jgi:hypothetical protein
MSDNNRGAFVSDGEPVSQSLFDVKPSLAEHGHCLFGSGQPNSAARAHTLCHTQQRAIAAAYVHQIIPRMMLDRIGNAFVNQLCNLLQVPAPQREVVRIFGMLRRSRQYST